jgi:hypothetical protein
MMALIVMMLRPIAWTIVVMVVMFRIIWKDWGRSGRYVSSPFRLADPEGVRHPHDAARWTQAGAATTG